MGTPNLEPVSQRGGRICDECLKWGQFCGIEPLTGGVYGNSSS